MSEDRRKITDFHNVVAPTADSEGVVLRFSGRNSAGSVSHFTVYLDWWAWPMLVKSVAKHWIQEKARRIIGINDISSGFPPERLS